MADCRIFQVERMHAIWEAQGPIQDSRADFFVMRVPDWVNIVAFNPEDEIVLIEQWRPGIQSVTLEVPGGVVDPGETPFETAVRELREETGFESNQWFRLGTTTPNPAIQDNTCHTFLARNAMPSAAQAFDPTEYCEVQLASYEEAQRHVASGRISHALVVSALHFEHLRRSGGLTPEPLG